MRKEPIAFYLFRLLLMTGILGFMFMLYWSSTLIEGNIRELKADITTMRREIEELPTMTKGFSREKTAEKPLSRPHIDPALPNLLKEDPFYTKTLPGLLPPGFKPHGTFHSADLGKPENLHPFSNWANVNVWKGMCQVTVAQMQFGKYETLAPNMAIKMEERINDEGIPEFWVHLRDAVYWAPLKQNFFGNDFKLGSHFLEKHQVTAEDFKFWFDAVMNPYNNERGAISIRTYFGDIEELRVIDPLTFVVRWKTIKTKNDDGQIVHKTKYIAKQLTGGLQPLASFVYKYFSDGTKIIDDENNSDTYRTSSTWAQNFSQHWAKNIIPSCGPWLFDGMTDQQVRFRRNPDFYQPLNALANEFIYSLRNSPDSIWQDFKSGNLDHYRLQPEQLLEFNDFLDSSQYREQADSNASIHQLSYLLRGYNYVAWNQATPFFASRKVRQAMTMAIDRQRIIQQNLSGMGVEITGTFFHDNLNAYDPSIKPWPYDPKRARQLLEEEGWKDSDGDGILDQVIDGKVTPFTFSLTYYVKNPTTKSICEYIATALKEIGINCQLNGVDLADISAKFEGKSFDALYLGWGLGTPPPDPKQIWHSEGAKLPASSNAVGFANAEADQIIEKLQYVSDLDERQRLYYRFDAIIHEEQPYTFLYTPKVLFLYRNWLKNVFIPAERQDLIPGADVEEPVTSVFWLNK